MQQRSPNIWKGNVFESIISRNEQISNERGGTERSSREELASLKMDEAAAAADAGESWK